MHADVVRWLRCPVCGEPLAEPATGDAQVLRCPRRHSFDLARQGYVNLLTGRAPHVGDSGAMVAARTDFLAAGHYDVVSTALADAATAHHPAASTYPPLVVDAGAGTGRHLAAVLAALPDAVGLALDVSKPALRRAARCHPRADAALADTWRRLPLADAATGVLLNVFAPRNGPEFRRVLRPDGVLLVVTPTAEHLTELVAALDLLRVAPNKTERVAGSLAGHFVALDSTTHRSTLELNRDEVQTLIGMGPSAWHTDPAQLAARLDGQAEPMRVTASVRLTVYRPR